MKIKILTIHSIHNFGSVFQASSLQKFLINEGYETEILDYRPKYFDSGRNRIKTYVGRFLNYKYYLSRKNKFDSFILNSMILSKKRYHDFNELKTLDNSTDLFIAGGDQLWNDYHYSGRDDAFKLTFVSNGKKFAFGTSMGRDNYTGSEIKSVISKVNDFDFIGLRESSSVSFIKNGGYENVHHVVDPVLLLDKDFFIKASIKPKIEEKYALLYLVDKSPLLDKTVNFISEKLGLKIVHVCGFRKKTKCDYFLKDPGPEEILGLLINAEFVISASFHATLFSILFNKKFVSLLPHKNTNARIKELLNYVGLERRIITDENHLHRIFETIEYDSVNKTLNEFSNNSKTLIRNALKNVKGEN